MFDKLFLGCLINLLLFVADIHTRLEKINSNFESCLKALMNHLEGRKQKFPRLYLLSQEDVLDIVCKGTIGHNNFFVSFLRDYLLSDLLTEPNAQSFAECSARQ